jgi:hypothetical protein
VLEPDEGKLSSPVLRGPGASNGARLLHSYISSAKAAGWQSAYGQEQQVGLPSVPLDLARKPILKIC